MLSVLLTVAAEGAVVSSSEHDQVLLALIAIIGTSIAALVYTIRNNSLGKAIAVDASAANRAVNNVGPGEHRLYDIIARIEAKQDTFDKAWGNLPPDMDDAVGLAEVLHSLRRDVQQIQAGLAEHVEWEQNVKWPAITPGPTEQR